MKSVLLYGSTFMVVLPLVTFIMLMTQQEQIIMAIEEAMLADSISADSAAHLAVVVPPDSIINDHLRAIDSLKTQLNRLNTENSKLQQTLTAGEEQALAETTEQFRAQTKTMARIYENMTPEEAAQIIAGLENDVAISVIVNMKKRKAGQVLAALDPQKAIQLSRQMSGTE